MASPPPLDEAMPIPTSPTPTLGASGSFSLKNRHYVPSTPQPELQLPLLSLPELQGVDYHDSGSPSKFYHRQHSTDKQLSGSYPTQPHLSPQQQHQQQSSSLETHILQGLTVAGVASCLLSTIFNLFHVDMFLNAFNLPLPTYSWGRGIFSVLSTVSSLLGAWWIDSVVATRNIPRQQLVGWAGCGLSLCFVLPFCRWPARDAADRSGSAAPDDLIGAGVGEVPLVPGGGTADDDDALFFISVSFWQWLDGAHFVISTTLYDTLFTMTAILLGAAVADDHHMTDHDRLHYMASSQVVNLIASLAIARLGLSIFDTTDPEHHLRRFQWFVVALAIVASITFAVAQAIIAGISVLSGGTAAITTKYHPLHHNSPSLHAHNVKWWQLWKSFPVLPLELFRLSFLSSAVANSASPTKTLSSNGGNTTSRGNANARPLRLRQTARELWHHRNFCVWIGMEVLLEAQTTFVSSFFKTFVDNLLWEVGGVSRATCDWFLSLMQPLQQIAAIVFMYGPIRRYGYKSVYWMVFLITWFLSAVMFFLATPSSTACIGLFLVIYPVASEAIRSAGYHLVMSDLVLERKRHIAVQGRVDEPSLAGMLLGAATLFCKPMQSLLPIIAATIMHKYDNSHDSGTGRSPQDDDEEGADQTAAVLGDNTDTESTSHLHIDKQTVLFYLLIVPAWVCSSLQLIVWSRFSLDPKRTDEFRTELRELERERFLSGHQNAATATSSATTAIRRHHGHGDV